MAGKPKSVRKRVRWRHLMREDSTGKLVESDIKAIDAALEHQVRLSDFQTRREMAKKRRRERHKDRVPGKTEYRIKEK